MSSRNQIVCVTPFTLAGAMAPVTVAGALVEQNAEALAGIAFTQMVRKGAPVIYGGFTSNVDMKSGAPAFGTPEYMKASIVGGQLARRYNVPYRTSNTCAANTVDAQAAYESVFSLWGVTMGGGNLIMHGGGLARRRPGGVLREIRARLRPDPDGDGIPAAAGDDRGCAGCRGHPRGRPRRPFLRRAAHAGALHQCLLCADHLRLAQQPAMAAAGKPEAMQKANAV